VADPNAYANPNGGPARRPRRGYVLTGALVGVVTLCLTPSCVDHPSKEDVVLGVLGRVGTGAVAEWRVPRADEPDARAKHP
jgi:hypothetical protein